MNNDKRIPFDRDELGDLLREWTNLLYKDNPPESIFDDNSQVLPDFLDGVFSIFEPMPPSGKEIRPV